MTGADDPLSAALEDRLRFETLVADLASHFVNLDSNLIDDAIQDAQRRLVEALDLDRSSLFQFSETAGGLVFTHYWSRPDLPPPPADLMTTRSFPWIRSQIMRGDVVAMASRDDLPAGALDREQIVRAGSKSNVIVPLVVAGRVIGALAFASMRRERAWPSEIIKRLSLIGHVFASALARKRTESELRRVLDDNARLRERLTEENIYLQHEMKVRQGPSVIIGRSPAISWLLEQVEQVAPTAATALLLGETGTGKELVATAMHERSPRGGRAMVSLNCAAIPATLIESELFGAEKGAYTGAANRQIGRFEVADGSTIFLDEVGELSGETQVKLLRVLQEREIERLGSARSIKIDVRVIAATNRDLERAVADGRFREDLYYRLNVFPILVPPLRERTEDIPDLAWTFVHEFSRAIGKRFESISKEHMTALQHYAWPGNVRELRNVIERAVIVSPGPRLTPEVPRSILATGRRPLRLDDVEREHIRGVLERTSWRIRGDGGAADLLGLKPSTLEGRMTKLDLRRPAR